MVLLTSSQVSAAISGGIVFSFTLLLFFSGYVLQQQSVRGLQAIIKPRIPTPIHTATPPPPPTQNPLIRAARPVGQHLPSPYQYLHHAPQHEAIRWSKLAYAQVVRDHMEVCGAVMLFAELAKEKSPAARVLMFPRTWTTDKSEKADPLLGRTRRLMRLAARRWNVSLRPMEPIAAGLVEGQGQQKVDEGLPSSYSLASLWELNEFERVLYLKGPGILVDSEGLDALLAFSDMGERPVAALADEKVNTVLSTAMMLVNPSIATYHQLKQRRAAKPGPDATLLREAFPGTESLFSPLSMPYFSTNVHSTTPYLRRIPPAPAPETIDETLDDPLAFNATAYLLSTSYIQLSDPELPGPEYDIPLREKERWRPANLEARRVWERMYDVYRGRRIEVCGLDLEAWHKPQLQEKAPEAQESEELKHELR